MFTKNQKVTLRQGVSIVVFKDNQDRQYYGTVVAVNSYGEGEDDFRVIFPDHFALNEMYPEGLYFEAHELEAVN